jgi:hypothetical protein
MPGSECWRLAQQAQAEAHILKRILHGIYPPHVAAFFFALREAIHRAQGSMARLLGCQTLRHRFLNLSLQVILQLFIQILLHPLAAEKGS